MALRHSLLCIMSDQATPPTLLSAINSSRSFLMSSINAGVFLDVRSFPPACTIAKCMRLYFCIVLCNLPLICSHFIPLQ
ncbi:hypothetical protein XELAEV_18000714mg [Xenopus laevis]|uniref:Uncharacterized protein n=1 Tax=Xenopus laevis TaxID=8355 RepID=A0A974BP99_XENLA|nr:hypothetical protein XELAEV_18000714mg [Xenopus laevis]